MVSVISLLVSVDLCTLRGMINFECQDTMATVGDSWDVGVVAGSVNY